MKPADRASTQFAALQSKVWYYHPRQTAELLFAILQAFDAPSDTLLP
jgi:hypothetical protein